MLTPFCVPNEDLLAYRQEVYSALEETALRNYTQSGLQNKQIVSTIRKTHHVTSHRAIIFGLLDGAPPWLRNVMPSKSHFRQTAAPKHPLYALQQAIAVRRPRKSTFAAPEHDFHAYSTRYDVRQFGGNASRRGSERKAASMSKNGSLRSRTRWRLVPVYKNTPLCSRTGREMASVSKIEPLCSQNGRKAKGEGGAGAEFGFQRKRSGREGAGPQRDDGVCPSAG